MNLPHAPFRALLCAVAALVPSAAAQSTETLLHKGQLVSGEAIAQIRTGIIADDGTWHSLVDAGFPARAEILRDGVPHLRQGDPVPQAGARIRDVQSISGAGENLSAIVFLFDFQPPRSDTPSALLRGDQVLLVKGEPTDVDGLPAGTLCQHIETVRADENDTVLAIARVGGGLTERALMRFEFHPDGTPRLRKKLLHTGDTLSDGSVVDRIPLSARTLSLNEHGGWLVLVQATDGVDRLVSENGVVLRADAFVPIVSRHATEILPGFDRNDLGGLATTLRVDGDPARDLVLLQNGALRARKGDLLPTVVPRILSDVGAVRLSASGNLYWHALVAGGGRGDGALLRDSVPFLETGVSVVGGELVTRFANADDNFQLSPSGRFLVAGVELQVSGPSLITTDFGASVAIPGCLSNAGTLRHTEGLVLAGRRIRLVLDGPASLGSLVSVYLSSAAAAPGSECGILTPFGELLISPAGRLGVFPAGFFAGGQVALDVTIPADPALVDREFFLQGAFRGSSLLLTNALRLEIGAP